MSTPSTSSPGGATLVVPVHPAIVRVCDCFEEDGDAYLVIDFIHGETLASRVTRLPPQVDEVLEWAEQICDALAYLHGQHPPVLMGDLEPGNLLLDERGKIRLFDFGLTRGFNAATHGDTSIPLGVGTAGYAPLEQERGEPCDTRSDLYSLGATIYTLLTGEVPPPAADILGAPGVRELNPEVPQSLDALVRHLTAPDRANRPSSVTVVQRALRGTISSRACPMCGRRVDLPGPCEACRPRPRPLRTTLALAVCMLAIAGALAWWLKPAQPRQFVLLDHAPGLRGHGLFGGWKMASGRPRRRQPHGMGRLHRADCQGNPRERCSRRLRGRPGRPPWAQTAKSACGTLRRGRQRTP